jgi:hypothetical protein
MLVREKEHYPCRLFGSWSGLASRGRIGRPSGTRSFGENVLVPEAQIRRVSSDIEMIPIHKINEAYDRMVKGDVKYRFVIDMKALG